MNIFNFSAVLTIKKVSELLLTSLLILCLSACIETDDSEDDTSQDPLPEEINENRLTTIVIGNGVLTISPNSSTCDGSCDFSFEENQSVEIQAIPNEGYSFSGFNGACTGTDVCLLTMTESMNISATFIEGGDEGPVSPPNDLESYKLTVNVGEGGSLIVGDNGLTCNADCDFEFQQNTTITFVAVANDGFTFEGLSGACSGVELCSIDMTGDMVIAATFIEELTARPIDPVSYKLTTNVDVGGKIKIEPTAQACTGDCEFIFEENSAVSITAEPADGYIFEGFTGACSGIETCSISVSEDLQLSALFIRIAKPEPVSYTLTTLVGDGGTLSIEPNAETCAHNCDFVFNEDTLVNVVATANEGFSFDGFTGACTGKDVCSISMVQALNIAATFTNLLCPDRASLPAGHFDNAYPHNNPETIATETLLTDFVVKESSGFGVDNYPVSMVFPLEQGKYFHVGDFHIKDADGNVVSAQFNVLNRWWAKDKSLRHVQAHFNVTIDAYVEGEVATGVQAFNLYAGDQNLAPVNPVCATESDTNIKFTNGLATIDITKSPLSISTPAGQLTSILTTEAGEVNNSFSHENIKFELEEVGEHRSVVKISSLSYHESPTDIKHGWALRLYLHANSTKVKVDFQLQNSALNVDYSAPLYFQNHELTLDKSGATTVQSLKAEMINEDKLNSGMSGAINTPNVNVYFRDFWQRFPQGLSTSEQGKLSVELYPSWSKQFLDREYATIDMYWLDDMRQSYQELLFDFTDQQITDSDTNNFQYPPVAVIPQEYYQKTSVTLELGGYFPLLEPSTESVRTFTYGATDFTPTNSAHAFNFGHGNYGLDTMRKRATSMTGGVPYSVRAFFISGNPKDYFSAQKLANGELNIRPQWLSGYKHDTDWDLIQPTANPYGGSSWRDFRGHGLSISSRGYIEGSSKIAHPRDDQHAWFYHMEQAYLLSGNKWIKDWFEFMAEYKMAYLQSLDPWPDRTNRSEGHNVSVAVSAYRVTGNEQLGDLLENYIVDEHQQYVLAPHNISIGKVVTEGGAAAFQQGFLMRSFIELYYEFPNQERTVELIGNSVNWNHDYSNYSYYRSIFDYEVSTAASGTGLSFVDVATWYSMHTDDLKYVNHAITYVDLGIGGVKPYYFWGKWSGGYAGQLYYYYLQTLPEE